MNNSVPARRLLCTRKMSSRGTELGTVLHRVCTVCQLRRTPGWETHSLRSIMEWPKRIGL